MKVSQDQAILSYLKRGLPLTPLLALNKFSTLRLGARIYDLRCAGYKIISTNKKVGNKRVAEYRLVA